MARPLRVGVVGTGFGQRVVAPVFAATDGCEVVDVVSARDESDVRGLIARPEVDLVSIHSPPFLHAPHVRGALARRKAVLCDKPFALDADEAAALESEADDAGVVALCNFEFRYSPARDLLRESVRDGSLGRIEHVAWIHASAGSRVPLRKWGWLFDAELGGGWIGAWGSHAVDAIRFIFDEVDVVQALRRIDVRERPDESGLMHECDAEDGFTAALVLRQGVTVALDSSFAASAGRPPRLTVYGSDATCEIVADERITIWDADGTHSDLAIDDVSRRAADRHLEPMRRWAEVIRDVVRSGDVPDHAPTFADGHACDVVLEQLRASPFAHLISGG